MGWGCRSYQSRNLINQIEPQTSGHAAKPRGLSVTGCGLSFLGLFVRPPPPTLFPFPTADDDDGIRSGVRMDERHFSPLAFICPSEAVLRARQGGATVPAQRIGGSGSGSSTLKNSPVRPPECFIFYLFFG